MKFGIKSPTPPKSPETLTAADARTDAIAIEIILKTLTLTPKENATSLPKRNKSIESERKTKMMQPVKINGKAILKRRNI